jgi:hypothetical protein
VEGTSHIGKPVCAMKFHTPILNNADPEHGNPVLWWVKDMVTHDMIVTGCNLKREAIQAIDDYLDDDIKEDIQS